MASIFVSYTHHLLWWPSSKEHYLFFFFFFFFSIHAWLWSVWQKIMTWYTEIRLSRCPRQTKQTNKKKKRSQLIINVRTRFYTFLWFLSNSTPVSGECPLVSLMTTIVNAGSVQSPVSVPHSFQTLPIQPLPTPPSKPCFLLVLYALLHFSVQMRGEHNIDFTEFYFLLFNIDRLKY